MTTTLPFPVTMIALGIEDPARSIRFYGETLGLPMAGQPGEVTMFRAGEVTIVLNRPLGASVKSAGGAISTGAVEVIFGVASVTAAHSELAGRGCRFIREPRAVMPGMWAATFTDPDGHMLTILGAQ